MYGHLQQWQFAQKHKNAKVCQIQKTIQTFAQSRLIFFNQSSKISPNLVTLSLQDYINIFQIAAIRKTSKFEEEIRSEQEERKREEEERRKRQQAFKERAALFGGSAGKGV